MSYCSETRFVVAKKQHQCAYCYEPILCGEQHPVWTYVDDSWSRNRMHPECLEVLQRENGDFGFEFSPGEGVRPEKEMA